MKKNIIRLFSLLLVISGLAVASSCSESLKIDTIVQGDPSITGFEPGSGKAGTEITVTGAYFRDVLHAYIGNVEAPIKYLISQQTAVIVVPTGAQNGKIVFKTKEKEAQSEQSFTVTFPQPSLATIPQSGKVNEEVEFRGSNLDIIESVYFKDTKAVISYQSEKELVVEVPFVLDDLVDIRLTYSNEQGEQSITADSKFEIEKPRPVLSTSMPAKVTEGKTITLTGENLDLIKKVMFGNVEASITRYESSFLTFHVPTLPKTASVKVVAYYYEETASVTLSESCEVFIPKVFSYLNRTLGSHRNANFGNLFNAATGDASSVCVLKTPASQPLIDFASVFNSGFDFAINSPHNTVNGLRNYWCDGKGITTANTLDALTKEGFGDFLSTKTLLKVLLSSKAEQAEIINKVVNGEIAELSPEATPALFNGKIVADKNSVRTRKTGEAVGTESESIFKVGSVIVFKNEKKKKVGLLYIRKINVYYDKLKADNDANASIEFDVYFER
ncbi:IPT/TIG domain-containing protein [Bacteroides sp. 224]|uniref:IPT/TIG domain-containing protein n=1 Tax=Bacteroides sp. 224 TaxID=2302936 RepID=UPI0013D43A59|nr:IPT/TIG domain-containing protein [Bacteroides sp. 224]NDV65251.1 DNA-binding protein [Bacteroides sp. 224]